MISTPFVEFSRTERLYLSYERSSSSSSAAADDDDVPDPTSHQRSHFKPFPPSSHSSKQLGCPCEQEGHICRFRWPDALLCGPAFLCLYVVSSPFEIRVIYSYVYFSLVQFLQTLSQRRSPFDVPNKSLTEIRRSHFIDSIIFPLSV